MANSPDIVELFKDALKEEGLDAEVSHNFNPTRQADVIQVKKVINGEPQYARASFSMHEQTEADDLAQFVAMRAGRIARGFNELLTEKVEWGDKCVQFDMKEGYSVTCFRCGASVDIDELEKMAPMMAETAVPNPVTYTSYRDIPEAKAKMALQAMLKDECDPMCPNAPDDRKI